MQRAFAQLIKCVVQFQFLRCAKKVLKGHAMCEEIVSADVL